MKPKVKPEIKKVVLAYSGGLDTSVIMRWLKNEYNCEVVTFTADLGQGEELEEAKKKAEAEGIKEIYIEDLSEPFVKDYVFPMFRANAIYEGTYLLGTSIARPIISKRMIEICEETGADAIAHGATGKGNDQVRFEFAAYALKPDIKVIAPWREWGLNSRSDIIKYAEEQGIEVPVDNDGGIPYSTDGNLLHISYESKALEDPWVEPADDTFGLAVLPTTAPDEPEYVEIEYVKGDPVGVNGEKMSPASILRKLNELGGKHGIGRQDIVENRYVGMKVRGVYETPGGTIMLHAHRALETLTVDRECMHLKDELMPKYAKLIYNGYWFSPEREMLQAAIDYTQKYVTGHVRLKLYKGNVMVVGRKSPYTLYNEEYATFEEDDVYNQGDAEGFIKISSLRLRIEKMAQDNFAKDVLDE